MRPEVDREVHEVVATGKPFVIHQLEQHATGEARRNVPQHHCGSAAIANDGFGEGRRGSSLCRCLLGCRRGFPAHFSVGIWLWLSRRGGGFLQETGAGAGGGGTYGLARRFLRKCSNGIGGSGGGGSCTCTRLCADRKICRGGLFGLATWRH